MGKADVWHLWDSPSSSVGLKGALGLRDGPLDKGCLGPPHSPPTASSHLSTSSQLGSLCFGRGLALPTLRSSGHCREQWGLGTVPSNSLQICNEHKTSRVFCFQVSASPPLWGVTGLGGNWGVCGAEIWVNGGKELVLTSPKSPKGKHEKWDCR